MSLIFEKARNRWHVQFGVSIKTDSGASKRIRTHKSLPAGTTHAQAQAIHDKMYADAFMKNHLIRPMAGWDDVVSEWEKTPKSWIHTTAASCKNRAARKGITCTLTPMDIASLLRRCRGRCEVSGVALNWQNPTGSRFRPYCQSLDRTDSAGPYSISNCRIVCYAVNLAMLNWGEDVFSKIATGYVINKYMATSLIGVLADAPSEPPLFIPADLKIPLKVVQKAALSH